MVIEKELESVYIIGDVHGCYNTLMELVKKLPKKATLVFVGDLIDRGADSDKVIEYVKDNNHYCVIGNHELAMKDEGEKLLNDPIEVHVNYWIKGGYGGIETLKSYRKRKKFFNKNNPSKTFKKDIQWLRTLPYYLEFKNLKDSNGRHLVVTHSTVDKYWENRNFEDETEEKNRFYKSILFGRNYNPIDNISIFNVFGHTPVATPVVSEYFANIDTGCVYSYSGKQDSLGILTALEFPSKKIIQQKNVE